MSHEIEPEVQIAYIEREILAKTKLAEVNEKLIWQENRLAELRKIGRQGFAVERKP